jgi:hypothetical protein
LKLNTKKQIKKDILWYGKEKSDAKTENFPHFLKVLKLCSFVPKKLFLGFLKIRIQKKGLLSPVYIFLYVVFENEKSKHVFKVMGYPRG